MIGRPRRTEESMAAKKPQKKSAAQDSGDVKSRMLAALEAKNSRAKDVPHDNPAAKLKASGPEVVGGAPKMHRRKSG